jgi:arsenite methyltransferase
MLYSDIIATMFNNRAKKDSRMVLKSLDIHAGDTIADIGSGGGWYSFAFAERTGVNGMVIAADTNKKLLARIESTARKQGIINVKTILCSGSGCPLPKESCDLVFMRNVFHHIKDPVSYIRTLREGLKPGGRITVIDWKETAGGYVGRSGHATPEAVILDTMREARLSHVRTFDFLSGQSFNIFRKDP